MRIIPAIDIIDGKCVRLTKGKYETQNIYYDNPLEAAKQFEDAGLQYLHLVDLDGAKSNHIVNYKVLEKIANKTALKIDFGGGIKTDTDVSIAFNSGARQITVGSIAVKNISLVEQWINTYGSAKIILGADCFKEKIAIQGWKEQSNINVIPFINTYKSKGIANVICTDISKDGMLEGPSFELYQKIINNHKDINLIASGGISSIADLNRLENLGCEGAIIGKALYEGLIRLKDLETIN